MTLGWLSMMFDRRGPYCSHSGTRMLSTLSGYEDGTFRPDESITRAEFVTIAVRYVRKSKIESKILK